MILSTNLKQNATLTCEFQTNSLSHNHNQLNRENLSPAKECKSLYLCSSNISINIRPKTFSCKKKCFIPVSENN